MDRLPHPPPPPGGYLGWKCNRCIEIAVAMVAKILHLLGLSLNSCVSTSYGLMGRPRFWAGVYVLDILLFYALDHNLCALAKLFWIIGLGGFGA